MNLKFKIKKIIFSSNKIKKIIDQVIAIQEKSLFS